MPTRVFNLIDAEAKGFLAYLRNLLAKLIFTGFFCCISCHRRNCGLGPEKRNAIVDDHWSADNAPAPGRSWLYQQLIEKNLRRWGRIYFRALKQ